jgi:hypothetical protein
MGPTSAGTGPLRLGGGLISSVERSATVVHEHVNNQGGACKQFEKFPAQEPLPPLDLGRAGREN